MKYFKFFLLIVLFNSCQEIEDNDNLESLDIKDNNMDQTHSEDSIQAAFDKNTSEFPWLEHHCVEPIPPISPEEEKQVEAVGVEEKFWSPYKKIFLVKFLNGSASVKKNVIKYAKEWERYCGVIFEFGNHLNPDITISFNGNKGNQCQIGTDCLKVIPKRPSMYLCTIDENTPIKEVKRIVLHEFGHALGLIHEHQNPEGEIEWNYDEVTAYYIKQLKQTEEWVDENIYGKYNFNDLSNSSFDLESIMIYPLSSDLTYNLPSTKLNYTLSEKDKEFIKSKYPK